MHRPASLLIVAAALSACGGPPAAPPAPPPPHVAVVTVEATTADLGPEAPGRVEGSRDVEVRARVSGILQRRLFDEGDRVRAGQTLFVIDPAEYRSAAQAARARLTEAKARLAQAERDQARLGPLVAGRAASQKSLDDATSSAELAAAAVAAAEASFQQAELELSWTNVTAPIDGMISRAIPSEGALVEPGDEGLLTRIVRLDPLWVRFSLPADQLAAARAELGERAVNGLPVELLTADGTRYPVAATVDFVDVRIDPATGTVALRAELPNPEGTLLPGAFVRVRLQGVVRENALLIPQRAVQQGRDGQYVYVVEGGVAHRRAVELGPWVGSDWLVDAGLEVGDQVVVDGAQKVRPEGPVSVDAAAPPAGEPAAAGAGEATAEATEEPAQ